MTLFNALFGSPQERAKRLHLDSERRAAIWKEYQENFLLRRELAKQNFNNPQNIARFVRNNGFDFEIARIGSLISEELVHIHDEEKTEEEIIDDLHHFAKGDGSKEIADIQKRVADDEEKEYALFLLFEKLHHILKTEIHTIKLIKKHPANMADVLHQLFRLIFNKEYDLYRMFLPGTYRDPAKADVINAIARRILNTEIRKEQFKDYTQTAEFRDLQMLSNLMGDSSHPDSNEGFILADGIWEAIWDEIEERYDVRIPFSSDEEHDEGMQHFEELIKDSQALQKIVKKVLTTKFHGEVPDENVKRVMAAFLLAWQKGYLEFDLWT